MRPPNQEPRLNAKEKAIVKAKARALADLNAKAYEQDMVIWYDVEGKSSILRIDPPAFVTVDVCSICNSNFDIGNPVKQCIKCNFSSCSACREWKMFKETIKVNPKLGNNKSNKSSYKYTAAVCPYCKHIMEKLWV